MIYSSQSCNLLVNTELKKMQENQYVSGSQSECYSSLLINTSIDEQPTIQPTFDKLNPTQTIQDNGKFANYLHDLKKHKYLVFMCLCIVVLFMAFSRSINFVLIVRLSTQMKHYGYFLSSIFIPLMSNVVYWPIAWIKIFGTKSVTKEMRKFPIYRVSSLLFSSRLTTLIMFGIVYCDGLIDQHFKPLVSCSFSILIR